LSIASLHDGEAALAKEIGECRRCAGGSRAVLNTNVHGRRVEYVAEAEGLILSGYRVRFDVRIEENGLAVDPTNGSRQLRRMHHLRRHAAHAQREIEHLAKRHVGAHVVLEDAKKGG